jgi:hypothetical protein
MKIGQRVRAAERLTEANFAGAALHVHAEVGEPGTVVDIDRRWVTVRFDRSDTAYSCTRGELRALQRASRAA